MTPFSEIFRSTSSKIRGQIFNEENDASPLKITSFSIGIGLKKYSFTEKNAAFYLNRNIHWLSFLLYEE